MKTPVSLEKNGRKKFQAVHVGMSGFPFGSAGINKCLALYQSLQDQNFDFIIINNRAVHSTAVPELLKKNGTVNNMRYVYTTPSPYREKSLIKRQLSGILGRINEFILLFQLSINDKIDVLFYYPTDGSFFELIYYRMFSKLFHYPLVSQYVEYRSSFRSESRPFEKWKHNLFDKYFMRYVDAVLPISEYLIAHLKSRGYNKPYIKIPPLTDFRQFIQEPLLQSERYFLYVGSAAYTDAIDFILQAFDRTKHEGYYLYLVVNGQSHKMAEVATLANSIKRNKLVRIYSGLKYSELLKLYINAKALLIPLTDTLQDKARFPQKISEYLASGNPVITTNYGEVPYYFTDGGNALVADQYDIDQYSAKLEFVIEQPEESKAIGLRGKETGLKYFDFNSYGSEIKEMIISLQE